jgi:hypothetical protein
MADIAIYSVPEAKYPPNSLLVMDRLASESFLIEVQTVVEL